MPPFVYRCPITDLRVQGFIADDPTEDRSEDYEAVKCTACIWTHWVNPKTGKVLGADDD